MLFLLWKCRLSLIQSSAKRHRPRSWTLWNVLISSIIPHDSDTETYDNLSSFELPGEPRFDSETDTIYSITGGLPCSIISVYTPEITSGNKSRGNQTVKNFPNGRRCTCQVTSGVWASWSNQWPKLTRVARIAAAARKV